MEILKIRSKNFWLHVLILLALLGFTLVGGHKLLQPEPISWEAIEKAKRDPQARTKLSEACSSRVAEMSDAEKGACDTFRLMFEPAPAPVVHYEKLPPRYGSLGND